jgi:hypothetical protein
MMDHMMIGPPGARGCAEARLSIFLIEVASLRAESNTLIFRSTGKFSDAYWSLWRVRSETRPR